jgi:RNA polymerase sigma-70 factor (ECF subfamily)
MARTALHPTVAGDDLRRVLHDFIARRVRDAHTADDLTQEVLLKIHRAGRDPDGFEDVAAWLYRIARNTLVDHYRHRQRHPGPDELPADVVARELDDDDDAVAARRQLAACVRPMVESLDPIYRDALIETDLGELSQAEAARRAGISNSTMKSRVQRARAQLRDAVSSCCAVQTDSGGRISDYEARAGCCTDTDR